jgi:hypothetical protein
MSDSFLFQSDKNKFQLLVFGTSITDARNYAKNTHPNFEMKFVSKNPMVNKYVCCATTEKQVQLNKTSLEKLLNKDN